MKMIKLISSDNDTFEVTETEALENKTIKNMIEDLGSDTVVPLSNVTSTILAKVIEYCKYHVEARDKATQAEEIKKWDAAFVDVDKTTLFEIILAANYLNNRELLDTTCQAVADMIKGKSPEEIRAEFGIENDFTPEEEAEVRKENQWAFE